MSNKMFTEDEQEQLRNDATYDDVLKGCEGFLNYLKGNRKIDA